MKKKHLFHYLVLILFVLVTSCKSNQKKVALPVERIDTTYNPDDFYYNDGGYSGGGYSGYSTNTNDVMEIAKSRIWQLVEIRIGYGLVALDRQQMAYNGLNDAYIIQFTDDGVSGKAAPNNYFAPYKLREGKNVAIQQIIGTYMSSNINVGGLMETEYYWYLQRITRMDIVNGFLELYATPSANEEIVLRYRAE